MKLLHFKVLLRSMFLQLLLAVLQRVQLQTITLL